MERKREELRHLDITDTPLQKLKEIKKQSKKTLKNYDDVLNYLFGVVEKFITLKSKTTTNLSKKETLEMARKDYEQSLNEEERKRYYIEEANEIMRKYKAEEKKNG